MHPNLTVRSQLTQIIPNANQQEKRVSKVIKDKQLTTKMRVLANLEKHYPAIILAVVLILVLALKTL